MHEGKCKRMDRVRERRWREINFYVERADIHHYYSKNINERENLSYLSNLPGRSSSSGSCKRVSDF